MRYVRLEAALHWAAWGLVGGLGAAVFLNAAAWALPITTRPWRLAFSMGAMALGVLLAAMLATLYPRSLMTVARLCDARMQLRARLATALEIQAKRGICAALPVPPEIADRQRADACIAAAQVDLRQAFAPHFPRRQTLVAALLLAALIVAFVIPNPQEAIIAQRQAEQAAIAKQIARLAKLREEIAANEELSPEDPEHVPRSQLLREIDETLHDLQEGQLSRAEAIARLSEAEDELKVLLNRDVDAAKQALKEAGHKATQGDGPGSESADRKSESTQPVGQALQQDDYEGAAQAMESLSEGLDQMSTDPGSRKELETTAQRVEAMAEPVASTNPELAQALREAAAAMQRGDVAAAQRSLQRAAELTRQAGQQIAAQEAIEQALAQIQEGRRELAQAGQMGEIGKSANGEGAGGEGREGGEGDPIDPQGPIQQPATSNQPDQSGQGGKRRSDQGPYDPIYAPERLGGTDGERMVLPGQEKDGSPSGEGEGGPREKGQVLVPYDEVYTDYQAQAASALENSYIPRGLKEYVRDYFSSLEPAE